MAIKNLADKMSNSDLATMNSKINHGEYQDGFGAAEDSSDDFDFDSLDDDFGLSSSDISGGSGGAGNGSSDFGTFGGNDFGTFGGTGLHGLGTGQAPNPFGQQPQPVEKKPSKYDEAWDFSIDGMQNTMSVIVDLFKSIKNRNIDDWALISQKLLTVGSVCGVIGLVALIVGTVGKVRILSISGISPHILVAGCFDLFLGLSGIGVSALLKISGGDYSSTGGEIDDIPVNENISLNNDSYTDEADDDFDDLMAGLFDDDDDEDEEDDEPTESSSSSSSSNDFDFSAFASDGENRNKIDYTSLIGDVQEKQPLINREYLFHTFKNFFPTNKPNFKERRKLDQTSEDYLQVATLLTQAVASATKLEMDELNLDIIDIEETLFAYIIKFKRLKNSPKTEIMEKEIVDYFKEDEKDESVTATIRTNAGNFIVTISKGDSVVVTMGDCLRDQDAEKYFCEPKNRLPFIMGIDDYGIPYYDDCKNYTSMLIAGLMRSGKSWYLLTIIECLAAFNTPEDIELLLIDPKGSTLFQHLSYMPHVCGLLSGGEEVRTNIISTFKDIVECEGARREKLLKDNDCDDIWALRDKGIKLPFLFIVIDEIMTLINDLKNAGDDRDKEFSRYMLTIMTQLPSKGIGLIFVPHRATGVIDKTQRNLVPFTSAVKSKEEDICDTLGIKRWGRPLTNPGEMAVNTSWFKNPIYLRGTGVTLSDKDNIVLIDNISKTFYKMGVEIPDMRSIGSGYNRDEELIKEKLDISFNKKIQYDLDNL